MTNDEVGKYGWNLSAKDSSLVRRYSAGTWSDPVNVQVAQLDLLDKIAKDLERIRFRVGFLALMILLGLLVTVFLAPLI